jgi:DNA polymerase-3 subunit beta
MSEACAGEVESIASGPDGSAPRAGFEAWFRRDALLEAFALASAASAARTPRPILRDVMLEVADGGEASLSATDLEVASRARLLGLDAPAPGRVLLPAERFAAALRSLPPGSDGRVAAPPGGGSVELSSGRSRFVLAANDPAEFPAFPEPDWSSAVEVPAPALRRALRLTAFASDPNVQSYALGGVLLEPGPGLLTLVATDGRRLALAALTPPRTPWGPGSAGAWGGGAGAPLLPSRGVRLFDRLLSGLDDDEDVALASGESWVSLRCARGVAHSRRLEGRFPQYRQILPGSQTAWATFDAGEILRGVEQASVVAVKESRGVAIRLGPRGAKLAADSADAGRCDAEVPAAGAGDDAGADAAGADAAGGDVATLTLDVRYLAEALKAARDAGAESARLGATGPAAPAELRCEAAGVSYRYVVMPIQ